jgi:hypothetical protein
MIRNVKKNGMSYATGYDLLTSQYLLNIHTYIYCRLCVINVWKKKLVQGMVLWLDLASMAGSSESKPASQEACASRVFSLILSPWLWTFFAKTWAAIFWLATLRRKEVVPSSWSPVGPISLWPKHVFLFFFSPRTRILNGTVLSCQLFSQPDVNGDTTGEAPGDSFATAYFAGSQYCVLCCLVKVEILRRPDLRFTKSCHMSKAGLEMGVDAGTRRLCSFKTCSF